MTNRKREAVVVEDCRNGTIGSIHVEGNFDTAYRGSRNENVNVGAIRARLNEPKGDQSSNRADPTRWPKQVATSLMVTVVGGVVVGFILMSV